MLEPSPKDVLLDIKGDPLPATIANVHDYDEIKRAWKVTTPEGVSGWVYWSYSVKGWVWL